MSTSFSHGNPQAQPCLDLCELSSMGDTSQQAHTALEAFLARDELQGCTRVYVGSSFCPQVLFSARPLFNTVVAHARERKLSVTLTLPIIAQRFWKNAQDGIRTLLEAGSGVVDEVTVNDLGMLDFIDQLAESSAAGTNSLRINMGRCLSKDTREPRDPTYPYQPYMPKLLWRDGNASSNLDRLRATWSRWREQESRYTCRIAGIELDRTHAQLDLSLVPAGVTVALHGTPSYLSTGQICEYAAIGRSDEQAFRPNSRCSNQCQHGFTTYHNVDGVDFHKIGRTVYFDAPEPVIIADSTLNLRLLHTPLKEVLS